MSAISLGPSATTCPRTKPSGLLSIFAAGCANQADLLLRARAAVVDAAESPERKTHGEKTKSRFTTDPHRPWKSVKDFHTPAAQRLSIDKTKTPPKCH